MKKALGMRSTSSMQSPDSGNLGSGGKVKKPVTIGELMRIQMRISEAADSRIRRGLLRISASQVRNTCFLSSGIGNEIQF